MILSRGNLQGPADQWEEEEPLHLISVWQETGEWRNSADADITIFYNIWYHGVNRIRKIDHWMISRKQSDLTNIRIIIEKVDTGTADCTEMWPVDMWCHVRCDVMERRHWSHSPPRHTPHSTLPSGFLPHTSHLTPHTLTLLLTLHLTSSSNLLLSFAS